MPREVERINGDKGRFADLGVLTVERVKRCPDEPQTDKLLVIEREPID